MAPSSYQHPAPDPKSRLRALLKDTDISPEIAQLRLDILRRDAPASVVQIDAVRADAQEIAIKATIALPGGARHSVIAAEDVDANESWADQLEMIQAVAIARALDGLGVSINAEEISSPPETSAPVEADTQDHLPEYSWNAFWTTMNARKITRNQVETALGKSIQEVSPREAVEALKTAGLL